MFKILGLLLSVTKESVYANNVCTYIHDMDILQRIQLKASPWRLLWSRYKWQCLQDLGRQHQNKEMSNLFTLLSSQGCDHGNPSAIPELNKCLQWMLCSGRVERRCIVNGDLKDFNEWPWWHSLFTRGFILTKWRNGILLFNTLSFFSLQYASRSQHWLSIKRAGRLLWAQKDKVSEDYLSIQEWCSFRDGMRKSSSYSI